MFKQIARPGRALIALALLAMLILPTSHRPVSAQATSLLSKVTSSGSVTGGRQMTIRVTLTQPAPPGGALAFLSASDPLIRMPPTFVVPGGMTSYAIKYYTVPTFTTTMVTISVNMGLLTLSTHTLVKQPYLSSLSVQSVIRAGGYGKVTPRISGPAPAGGVKVTLSASPDGVLNVPLTATIPEGATAVYLVVPASMVDTQSAVTVTAKWGTQSFSKPTIVRNMS
jgi:hypothetical protein